MGNRPRIRNASVDVRDERNTLIERMKEKHPDATRTEILNIISSSQKKEKETPSVAGIKVSLKVKKALETLPNQDDLTPERVAELGSFGKGLEAEIAKFRAEKNKQD